MPAASPSADPGDLTVPLLLGWEYVAVVLGLVLALVVVVSLVGAARAGRGGRSEWQAWLDARSAPEDAGDPRA